MEPIILEAGRAEKHYWRDLWHYRNSFKSSRGATSRSATNKPPSAWRGRWSGPSSRCSCSRSFLEKWRNCRLLRASLMHCSCLPECCPGSSLRRARGSEQQSHQQFQSHQQNLLSPSHRSHGIGDGGSCRFPHQFLILIGMMIWFPVSAGVAGPATAALRSVRLRASLGPGLWITALNVKYRDFRYIIPFLVQIGFVHLPRGFSSDVIPERWRLLYSLNPMSE